MNGVDVGRRRRFEEDYTGGSPSGAPEDALVREAISNRLNEPATGVPTNQTQGGDLMDRMRGGAELAPDVANAPPRPTTMPRQGNEFMDRMARGVEAAPGVARDRGLAGAPPADEPEAPGEDDIQEPPAGETGIAARKALGGYAGVGNMLGFNTALDYPDDKAANSAKNTFGRIASRYEAKPSSLKLIAADPDFQRHFPGAWFDDKDRLHLPPGMMSDFESGTDISGEEGIDVLGSADVGSDTAAGWTWQDLKNDGGGAPMGGDGGAASPFGITADVNSLTSSDALAAILREIDQMANSGDPQQAEALRRLLEEDSNGLAL